MGLIHLIDNFLEQAKFFEKYLLFVLAATLLKHIADQTLIDETVKKLFWLHTQYMFVDNLID